MFRYVIISQLREREDIGEIDGVMSWGRRKRWTDAFRAEILPFSQKV